MISITVSLLQVGILLGIIIASYVVVRYIITFILGIVLGSLWYIRWQMNRKSKAQKMIKKTQHQELYDKFRDLGGFIDWLDKQFPNSQQRKQFWSDWIKLPVTRQTWIDKFQKQYAPEMKIITKPKVKIEKVEKKTVEEKKTK